ncbi:MAG: hypothetical protein FWC68_00690 [Oscillospiraceae bacterium]|nr:hypothetical protein [Oscillospiraceae bacterium]
MLKENLKVATNDNIRLLSLQKEIREGRKKEEDLEEKDITLLKKLYCEQIMELTNSIKWYNKELKIN